jgi:hypothetical protein
MTDQDNKYQNLPRLNFSMPSQMNQHQERWDLLINAHQPFKASISKNEDCISSEETAKYDCSVVDSPYKAAITTIIEKIHFNALQLKDEDACMSIKSALYFAIDKRISHHKYDGDDEAYLMGLLNDIDGGKREFMDVCYDSDDARDAFMALKIGLITLLNHLEQ